MLIYHFTEIFRKSTKELHTSVPNGPNFEKLKSATLEPATKYVGKKYQTRSIMLV